MATDGVYLYVLLDDGVVWRAQDFTHWYNWTRYTYVPNTIALYYWPGKGLMVSDRSLDAKIWKA